MLPAVSVVVPTVEEATKYEGVGAAPLMSGSMPRKDLVVEAWQVMFCTVPEKGASTESTAAYAPEVVAVHVVVVAQPIVR